MDNLTFGAALLELYSVSEDPMWTCPFRDRLAADCMDEMSWRLHHDEAGLRMFLSRLIREFYLSEDAISRGAGVDMACGFWYWLAQSMWPRPQLYRVPIVGEATVESLTDHRH